MASSGPPRSENPQTERRRSPDSGANPETGTNSPSKAKRRNRVINSCLECRRRKLKCDRGETCQNCQTAGRDCAYVDSTSSDGQFRRRLAEMKEAKDALDNTLLNTTHASSASPASGQRKRTRPAGQVSSDDSSGSENDDGYLDPSPFALRHAAYADDADDDIDDLGVRIGRMWLGERIGGFNRPRIADELKSTLRRARQALPPSESPPSISQATISMTPSPGLVFSQLNMSDDLTEYIPPRHIADKLMEQYWAAVHPVARIVHRPSFATRYETLWECVESGSPVVPSLAATVCSLLFSAVVSMSEAQAVEVCHTTVEEIQSQLKLGAEIALSQAQLLKTTKVETLQAFVAYLLPMCINRISRAHSVLTGMLVRLAECMGLHRDPAEFEFSPAESHTRRLIWYQICYLDLKTSEIQGPRRFIHHNSYTTRLPLDVALPGAPTAWNDAIFSMIRFECQEMQRRCGMYLSRVDQKRMTLTKMLSKIEAFRLTMDAKYGPYINSSSPSPMQRMARLLLNLWVSILYLIPLHRYMNSVTYRIPDRLRQIVLVKGTEVLEAAVELESAEELKQWAWYSLSYQQYHTAFLLLVEMFKFPRRREANRIWRCFDYIFDEPLANAPLLNTAGDHPTVDEIIEYRALKAQYLITIISDQMGVYHNARGQKLPSRFKGSTITRTPGKDGDDSDPRMPLNYAHGEPETPDPTQYPQPPDAVLSENTSNLQTGFSQAPENAPSAWPSPGQFSPWIQASDTHIYSAGTHLHPGNRYGYSSSTPNDSLSAPHSATGEVDLEMLEIDWDLWDTIFPPQANDGMLDIANDYLWDSSVPDHATS